MSWRLLYPDTRAEQVTYLAILACAAVVGGIFGLTAAALMVGGGLVLVNHFSEVLIEGCVALSERFGVSRLLIGVIVLGFGTSLPELMTSLMAAGRGRTELVIGNVAGSNIANVLLALGVAAVIHPVVMNLKSALRELVPMLAATGLFAALVLGAGWQGGGGTGLFSVVARWEALLLFGGLVLYLVWVFRRGRPPDDLPDVPSTLSRTQILVQVFVGMGGLVGGSALLLEGAVEVAAAAGISELVIGLTVVAIGTSLPEIVAGIKAARAGEPELVLGNVLGSNLFNILAVAGVSGMVHPLQISAGSVDRLWIDFVFMGASAFAIFPLLVYGRIGRGVGALMVGGYVAYLSLIVVGRGA